MFGVPRKTKKSKPTKIHSAAPSSDDDDIGARGRIERHRRKKKGTGEKKRKTKTTTMLSFDPEDSGNEEEPPPRRKSKKEKEHSKRRKKMSGGGLGYGGLGVMPTTASDGSASEGERKKIEQEEEDVRGGNYYDAAALEKLRSEQKRSTIVKDDTVQTEPAATSLADEKIVRTTKDDEEKNTEEEEFIPLSGGNTESCSRVADSVVLTGDEAMAYARREEEDEMNVDFDHGLQSPPTPPPDGDFSEKDVAGKVSGMEINADVDIEKTSDEVEEGNRRWEDTMARRAGVLPPNAAKTNDKHGRPRQKQGKNSPSLSQIRASLQPTISNLGNVYSDLETSIHRHEPTLSSTGKELERHRSTLKKHGQALEYYQGLREDLATWMGALRKLNGMVEKVEEAKHKLESEMTWRRLERFWEWGNDCTEVLEKQGLLKTKVVGEGCHPDETNGNAPKQEVDEFGRDLSSMASMARVKRWNQRRKRSIALQDSQADDSDLEKSLRQSIGCSNEDSFDSGEIEEWRRRREALSKAITIIPDLVKDDYLSISNLCTLFFNWERQYPEDYANCYAEISLVQMISVLVRLELCERWDVLDLRAHSSSVPCLEISEFKWFNDLKLDNSQRDANGEMDETDETTSKKGTKFIFMEVVQKQVFRRILESFAFEDGKDHNKRSEVYDPFSVTQTKQLCSVLTSMLGYFSNCSEDDGKLIGRETVGKVLDALLSSVKYFVGRMDVPIADASKITLTRNQFEMRDASRVFDGETADAISYASVIQVKEFCILVENILSHWYPIFDREICHQRQDGVASLVEFLFEDLISIRILPALQSLHDISSEKNANNKMYSEMSKLFINDILDLLNGTDLLENDKYMLMATPLRVAAKQWDDCGS